MTKVFIQPGQEKAVESLANQAHGATFTTVDRMREGTYIRILPAPHRDLLSVVGKNVYWANVIWSEKRQDWKCQRVGPGYGVYENAPTFSYHPTLEEALSAAREFTEAQVGPSTDVEQTKI